MPVAKTFTFSRIILDIIFACLPPSGSIVTITSTRSPGLMNPATPMTSSTLTDIARLSISVTAATPPLVVPSGASFDSRRSSFLLRSTKITRSLMASKLVKWPSGIAPGGNSCSCIISGVSLVPQERSALDTSTGTFLLKGIGAAINRFFSFCNQENTKKLVIKPSNNATEKNARGRYRFIDSSPLLSSRTVSSLIASLSVSILHASF